ncbi:MAG: peptidoglycan-associated lipoprotein Pal [Rhodobacteraceae bacterium]|nr:peptidoglycan-associated lipoprotein Pal [Paracoccaceae bacterium]
MKQITKVAFLVLALGASACTNPGRFDNMGGAGAGGAIVPGSAADPSSPVYFQQTVGDRVLFEVDQSTLGADARDLLVKQAAWLMENPDFTAIIEGHADEQGTREYNLALGARRASAVLNYLIDRGVAPNRLRTVSYGKERPIEICSDEACYSQNRRAVTVISAGGLTS